MKKNKDIPLIKYFDYLMFPGLYIGFTTKLKKFKKETKRIGTPNVIIRNAAGTVYIFDNAKERSTTLIFVLRTDLINSKPTNEQINGLIVHESVHTWQQLKKHIGEDFPSDELEAYHIQNLYHQIYREYKNGK